jgi:hypothetical protein
MKRHFSILAALPLFGLTVATPANAESAHKAIQPDAQEIARILAPDVYFVLVNADLEAIRNELQRQLLSMSSGQYGAPCDRQNSDCVSTANAIAAKYATKAHDSQMQAIQKAFTQGFNGMSLKDLASTKAFLETPAGAAFAAGMKVLFNPFGPDAAAAGIMEELNAVGSPLGGMHEEFSEATKHLPKAELPRVPRPEPPARKRDQ